MSGMDGSRGVVAEAVNEAAQIVAARATPEVQDDLFVPAIPDKRLRQHTVKGLLVTTGGLSDAEIAAEGQRQRKAGRPAGSQNRSTRELREFLLKTGIVPQQWQMRWLLVEPEDLAKRLGITVAEAFSHQARIAADLAPYMMARMAPTDDKGNAVPFMALLSGQTVIMPGSTVPANAPKPWEYPGADNDVIDMPAGDHAKDPAA